MRFTEPVQGNGLFFSTFKQVYTLLSIRVSGFGVRGLGFSHTV